MGRMGHLATTIVLGLGVVACEPPQAQGIGAGETGVAPVAVTKNPDGRVRVGGGRLSFELPAGWRAKDCSFRAMECVDLRPPGGSRDRAPISVDISKPVEAMPMDEYLYKDPPKEVSAVFVRTKVDGVPALWLKDTHTGVHALYGYTTAGDRFWLGCFVNQDSRVRPACDHVAATLKIGR